VNSNGTPSRKVSTLFLDLLVTWCVLMRGNWHLPVVNSMRSVRRGSGEQYDDRKRKRTLPRLDEVTAMEGYVGN
jgi:hypothetical protein